MLSNGKEDEQPVNALQTSDLGTILDQTMSSCMFLHFPSSVSKLKGKTNKHWVSLKSPKAACKRAIIPGTKPSNWELVPYLPWKSNLFPEITEKRKLFKLIFNMFPFISNTKIAFELSYSFPLFLHIYMEIIIQISRHRVHYISLKQLADPWGGVAQTAVQSAE